MRAAGRAPAVALAGALLLAGCATAPVYRGGGIRCSSGDWSAGAAASRGPATSGENALMDEIDSWMGTPYVYGGESRTGVDCSGFTQAVFGAVGVAIPRTASQQAASAERVDPQELSFGDLLFFDTSGSGISHVGIYVGNGYFVHSSSSRGVVRESMAKQYYADRIVQAGRVME